MSPKRERSGPVSMPARVVAPTRVNLGRLSWLIGAGLYNLSPDEGRQMTLDDYLNDPEEKRQELIEQRLRELQTKYGLDFAGHMDEILHGRVLYRTIEYMRKHYND